MLCFDDPGARKLIRFEQNSWAWPWRVNEGPGLILHFKKEVLTLAERWELKGRAAAGDRNGGGVAQEAAVMWLLGQAVTWAARSLLMDLINNRQ